MASLCCSITARVTSLSPRRSFSSAAAVSSSLTSNNQNQKKQKYAAFALAAASVLSAGAIYTRHIRHEKVSSLTSAKVSGLISKEKVLDIITKIKRAGLMGSTKSVKEELDLLRKYHIENGYHGGLIVRDLSQPLFSLFSLDESNEDDIANKSSESNEDMSHRECYYLYYEIKPNGHTKQEIFCRGTTLLVDVLTW